MTSPYLEQPLVPLAVALPQMLKNIEADLADSKLDAVQTERLRWRAELIRWLLMPGRKPSPSRSRPARLARVARNRLPRCRRSAWALSVNINHAEVSDGRMPKDLEPERF